MVGSSAYSMISIDIQSSLVRIYYIWGVSITAISALDIFRIEVLAAWQDSGQSKTHLVAFHFLLLAKCTHGALRKLMSCLVHFWACSARYHLTCELVPKVIDRVPFVGQIDQYSSMKSSWREMPIIMARR